MLKLKTLLDDRNQHIGADRNPDLRLHRILALAQKRLDSEVLLDPLEEQLHLPSLPIQRRNQFWLQRKIVGQKRHAFALLVLDDDAAQRDRVVLARIKHRKCAHLIADNVGILAIHRLRIPAREPGIPLGTGDEEGQRLMDREQPPEIQITPVEQVIGARLDHQLVERIDLVRLAVGDVDEGRDTAANIQQRMQLDRGFGLAKRGPGIDRQAQIDGGGVEGVNSGVQIEGQWLAGVERAGDANQMLGEVGVDLPRPGRVRLSQRIARDRLRAKAHVVQPGRLCAKIDLDIAQRLARGQLRKSHGEELIQAREGLHLVIASMGCHAAAKGGEGHMGCHLRKYEHASMHKSLWRRSAKGLKLALRCSNRDQTKSLVSVTNSLTYNRLS